MAAVKIVPEEDMRVLEKYLDAKGVVLISEAVVRQLPEICDNMVVDYNFGGDADVWVDIVRDDDHYFLFYQERLLNGDFVF